MPVSVPAPAKLSPAVATPERATEFLGDSSGRQFCGRLETYFMERWPGVAILANLVVSPRIALSLIVVTSGRRPIHHSEDPNHLRTGRRR